MRLKSLTAITGTMFFFMIAAASCSSKLPPETLPVVVDTPETSGTVVEETVFTETAALSSEQTDPEIGPMSTPQVTDIPVDVNGQLSVSGTQIVNEFGDPVRLKGMSSYNMTSVFQFFSDDVADTLIQDWGCNVIRLAMTTRGYDDGYTFRPDRYFEEVCGYADTLIEHGVYVIIDWHILYDGDPNEYLDEAVDFFSRISALYGDHPNVIYEICNEPNGMRFDSPESEVDWDGCIRPYAQTVISAIRENDPDNIIIVGTPNWSQDVDAVLENPLEGENIMYTLHFYAGSHGQELMDKAQTAIDGGLPVFCTEWGTSTDSGGGGVFYDETYAWMDFLDENSISWCNWSIGGSNTESSNALKLYSNRFTIDQKLAGHWPDEMLSASGQFVRALILGQDFTIPDEG